MGAFVLPAIFAGGSFLADYLSQSSEADRRNRAKRDALNQLESSKYSTGEMSLEQNYADRVGSTEIADAANRYGIQGRGVANKSAFLGAALSPFLARSAERSLGLREKMISWNKMLDRDKANIMGTPDQEYDFGQGIATGLAGAQAGIAMDQWIAEGDRLDKLVDAQIGSESPSVNPENPGLTPIPNQQTMDLGGIPELPDAGQYPDTLPKTEPYPLGSDKGYAVMEYPNIPPIAEDDEYALFSDRKPKSKFSSIDQKRKFLDKNFIPITTKYKSFMGGM